MPEIAVVIAGQFDAHALPSLGGRFLEDCQGQMPEAVALDLSRLRFIRPVGVTFLSNFIYWLVSQGVRVRFTGTDNYSRPLQYLDDAQFFTAHTGRTLANAAIPRQTTLPFRRLTSEDSHWWIRNEFVPWMARSTGTTQASIHPYHACIAEILNNTQDHSTIEISSIFVQHFPNENNIMISVADFGVGVPTTVRRVENVVGDANAIVRAVERGFSARTTPGNQGIGLDELLNSVVRTNGGEVTIVSLRGRVRFYRTGNNINYQAYDLDGFCPGTTIEITIRSDGIERIEDEAEDLQW